MKSFILIMSLLVSSMAFAGPATKQRCVGQDSVSYQQATFNLIFADWGPQDGYTRQELEVIRIGSERMSDKYDLTTPGFRTCRGRSSKRLSYLRSGMTRFTATCDGVKLYSITASCKHVNF